MPSPGSSTLGNLPLDYLGVAYGQVMRLRLVGAGEIRIMLGGVSKQRVYQITTRKGFPEPVATLRQGKVWRAEDVERWIRDNRSEGTGD